jgi:Family of unknown function (DUF6580)
VTPSGACATQRHNRNAPASPHDTAPSSPGSGVDSQKHRYFLLFTLILNLAIDFSIRIDFVESLPDYFPVMLAALILIFAVTLYRVCYALAGSPGAWANFSPLAAILLCSAAYLPRKVVLIAGLGPLVVADLFLNAHYHARAIDPGLCSRYFCFGLIVLLGYFVRKQHQYKVLLLFASTIAGSCLFYLITNTTAWITTADYPKTLQGWGQALTIGVPGFPPTLFFFRNTVLSDLFFTALFVITQAIFNKSRSPIAETAPPVARNQT